MLLTTITTIVVVVVIKEVEVKDIKEEEVAIVIKVVMAHVVKEGPIIGQLVRSVRGLVIWLLHVILGLIMTINLQPHHKVKSIRVCFRNFNWSWVF